MSADGLALTRSYSASPTQITCGGPSGDIATGSGVAMDAVAMGRVRRQELDGGMVGVATGVEEGWLNGGVRKAWWRAGIVEGVW